MHNSGKVARHCHPRSCLATAGELAAAQHSTVVLQGAGRTAGAAWHTPWHT
jgi:hypothetical protein